MNFIAQYICCPWSWQNYELLCLVFLELAAYKPCALIQNTRKLERLRHGPVGRSIQPAVVQSRDGRYVRWRGATRR